MQDPDYVVAEPLTIETLKHPDDGEKRLYPGFYQVWIEGVGDAGVRVELCCQAGCGGAYLWLVVERSGKKLVRFIDARTLMDAWANQMMKKDDAN